MKSDTPALQAGRKTKKQIVIVNQLNFAWKITVHTRNEQQSTQA